MKRLLLYMLLFAGLAGTARSQVKVANLDISFQYRAGQGMRGQLTGYRQDSSLFIMLLIHQPLDSLRQYEVSYSLLNSLNEEVKAIIPMKNLAAYFQFENEAGSYFGMRLAAHEERFFVLWLADTASRQLYPYVSELKRLPQPAGIQLQHPELNAPLFNTWLTSGSRIRVKSLTGNPAVTVDFYDYHFMPARPPMAVESDSLLTKFTPDRSWQIKAGEAVQLDDPGMYYFHLPDHPTGHSLVVRQPPFPRFGHIDMLAEALRYITTDEEYRKLHTSFEKKKLFDEFWLNNTRSQAKAKRTIREYYKRATQANLLFTTYKEGWKTDMGMIYLIFGPPPRVFLKDEGVLWIYPKTFELPRVAFFFRKINTAFTRHHYMLERKEEYRNVWLRTIDLWRSGRKQF